MAVTDLFALIKSMSKAEKRFFTMNAMIYEGEKNYVKLFNAIDKQDTYDEQKLRKELADESFVKHLRNEKHHLYEMILKSLRTQYQAGAPSIQIRNLLQDAEMLQSR